MIMSTVRSSLVTNHPGFLSEPKRFNVAVTRAKRLLVVIGDTRMMSKAGRCWQRLILHADKGKSLFKHQDVAGMVEGSRLPLQGLWMRVRILRRMMKRRRSRTSSRI